MLIENRKTNLNRAPEVRNSSIWLCRSSGAKRLLRNVIFYYHFAPPEQFYQVKKRFFLRGITQKNHADSCLL